MHIQTHIMSGWCIANCVRLTARERLLAMLAASLPDMDGISYIFGQEAYWATHHIYGHNLLYGVLLAGLLAAFSTHKVKCFLLFLGLIHLHFILDLLGSGEGWTIPYFLPFSKQEYAWSFGWDFNDIENKIAGLLFLLWSLQIAVFRKRTPLEYIMPRLDARLVKSAQKLRTGKASVFLCYWWLPPACFYGMEVFHEAGHILSGLLTGAHIASIDLLPWQLSRTGFSTNPSPGTVVWSGPIGGILFPVILWLCFRHWKYACLLRFFAGFAMIANGLYIGIGGFGNIGDCLEMLRTGTPLWVMLVFGLVSAAGGLLLWNGQGKSFLLPEVNPCKENI